MVGCADNPRCGCRRKAPPLRNYRTLGALSKRRRRLSGLGYNSAASYAYVKENPAVVRSVADGMIAEGYDARIVNALVAAGATSGDLQNLWDRYTASANANDPDGFGAPALRLLQAINAQHAPGAGGGSVFDPSGANPIVNAAADAASSVSDSLTSAANYIFSPSGTPGSGLLPWWGWAALGAGALIAIKEFA